MSLIWPRAAALAWLASVAPVTAQSPPAAATADVTVLRQKSVTRTLTPGGDHLYRVEARPGDYVHVQIEQSGIDIVASVRDPDGQPLGEFDSPTGALGPEPVRFMADVAGPHLIEVRTLQPEGDAGRYTIKLRALRPATAADRRLVAAVLAHQAADRLRASAATRAQSLARYDEAVQLWRAVPDRSGEAAALRAKGFAYIRSNDEAQALAVFRGLRQEWQGLGDLRSEAYTLLVLGTILRRQGQLEASLVMDETALPIWRKARDLEQEAFTLATLGTTHARLGDRSQGERLHRQSLSVARRARSAVLEAAIFRSLANARQQTDDSAGALEANAKALALWRQAGHRRGQATTLVSMAEVQESQGDRDQALDSLTRAAALWDTVGATAQAADARKRIETLRQKDAAPDGERRVSTS